MAVHGLPGCTVGCIIGLPDITLERDGDTTCALESGISIGRGMFGSEIHVAEKIVTTTFQMVETTSIMPQIILTSGGEILCSEK